MRKTAVLLIGGLLTYGAAMAQTPPPEDDEYISKVIGELANQRTRTLHPLTLQVATPTAPNAGDRVDADSLPPGATLTNLGNGFASFSWTPTVGQEGAYNVTFIASSNAKSAGGAQVVQMIVAAYPLSHGMYRMPYGNGEGFVVTGDHVTHNPPIKEDWVSNGNGPLASIPIVAAADGRIRSIVDDNTVCCGSSSQGINCSACNNSVWIEHTNGEWTKYSHFQTGTVTGAAGLDTNDCVVQGQLLGYEGQIGHTNGNDATPGICTEAIVDSSNCGIHLHWEVRMTSMNSDLRVPILCEVNDHIANDGDNLFAFACNGSGCADSVGLPLQGVSDNGIHISKADIVVTSEEQILLSTSVAYFAGERIRLKPGFKATTGTYFHAMIRPCEGGPTGCPPQ